MRDKMPRLRVLVYGAMVGIGLFIHNRIIEKHYTRYYSSEMV